MTNELMILEGVKKLEEEEGAKLAHQLREEAVKLVADGKTAYFEAAKRLWIIKNGKVSNGKYFYELLGFDNFTQFMASPQASGGFGERALWRVLGIHENLIIKCELPTAQVQMLPSIDQQKLEIISRVATRENVVDLIEEAQHLGRDELKRNLLERAEISNVYKANIGILLVLTQRQVLELFLECQIILELDDKCSLFDFYKRLIEIKKAELILKDEDKKWRLKK